jgi:hypothetical protein
MTDDQQPDWREEFECPTCRAWTGKPPITFGQLKESPPDFDYRASHACYYWTDAGGRSHHIPTTVLEWEGGRIQWIPELPPGHKQ